MKNQKSTQNPGDSPGIISMIKEFFELSDLLETGLLHPSYRQKALAMENKIRSELNMPPASSLRNSH